MLARPSPCDLGGLIKILNFLKHLVRYSARRMVLIVVASVFSLP
jgi:hypothetical protein